MAGLEVAASYRAGGDEVESIGGDWFDVLPVEDGGAVVVVGDVMGRGVRAATTMTRMRASVRAYAAEDPDPGAVLTRLDRLVLGEGLQDFVTLLVCRLDPATGELRAANAGHLRPTRGRGGGGARAPRDSRAAGRAGRGRAPDVTATLPAGATLLLFTDGLVERPGHDIDEGIDLVVEVAEQAGSLGPGGDDVGRLVADVVRTLADGPGEAGAGDDVTVLGRAEVSRAGGAGYAATSVALTDTHTCTPGSSAELRQRGGGDVGQHGRGAVEGHAHPVGQLLEARHPRRPHVARAARPGTVAVEGDGARRHGDEDAGPAPQTRRRGHAGVGGGRGLEHAPGVEQHLAPRRVGEGARVEVEPDQPRRRTRSRAGGRRRPAGPPGPLGRPRARARGRRARARRPGRG